jgi:hypothetical protein
MLFFVAAMLGGPCGGPQHYRLAPVTGAVTLRRDAGVYRASATLRFRLVAPPSHKTVVDRGSADHLRGQAIIAKRVAASSNGTVQAIGSSAAQARLRLRASLDRLRDDTQNELDREERLYDSVTQGGLAQDQGPQFGFPGGQNSRVRCEQ